MSNSNQYHPPEVWTWEENNEKIGNKPTAGARFDQQLPFGKHPLQLYSLGTPNGQKVTIMLEELLELGIQEAEYDAFLIDISQGHQFSSGFVDVNPNSKIPALVDTKCNIRVFESASIVLYLANKFGQFLPKEHNKHTEIINWLFWLQGAAPFIGGGFGHFYHYAPVKVEYAINRYTMETKRILDVADKELKHNQFFGGNNYSIADIVSWPWIGNLILGKLYNAGKFLDIENYKNIIRWAEEIEVRPAVKRGILVNKKSEDNTTLPERHSMDDFDKIVK